MTGPGPAPRRGGWPGPRKVEVNVTLPPDQLAAIEAYAAEHGVNRSEAIRQLIDAGRTAEVVRAAVGDMVEAYSRLVTVSILTGHPAPAGSELDQLRDRAAGDVGGRRWDMAVALAGDGRALPVLEELHGRSEAGAQSAEGDVDAARLSANT